MNDLKCCNCGGPLGEVSGTATTCPHCGTALLLPKDGPRPAAPTLRAINGLTTISAIVFGVFSLLFGIIWTAMVVAMWNAFESDFHPAGLGAIASRIVFAALLLLGGLFTLGLPALMIALAVKTRRFAKNAETGGKVV